MAAIQIVLNIGSYVSFAAQLAILQDIVCKSHYKEGQSLSMDDDRCKVDAVQSEIAFINGWKDVFEMLPGTFGGSKRLNERKSPKASERCAD